MKMKLNLARILYALDENRIRATIDTVAELADVSARNLLDALMADPARARWVVAPDTYGSIMENGREYSECVDQNPIVICDASRLRGLVLATELTSSRP